MTTYAIVENISGRGQTHYFAKLEEEYAYPGNIVRFSQNICGDDTIVLYGKVTNAIRTYDGDLCEFLYQWFGEDGIAEIDEVYKA